MGLRHALAALPLALGLLAGCPTVDLGDTPTDIGLCNPPGGVDYFTDVIWPDMVRPSDGTKGCTKAGGCHNEAGGNGLSFRTQPAPDFPFNFRQAQLYLNCGNPMQSLFLTKPLSNVEPHGGNDLIDANADSAIVDKFLAWF
jgi:hypothetical protein